jgi:hypothetical protein
MPYDDCGSSGLDFTPFLAVPIGRQFFRFIQATTSEWDKDKTNYLIKYVQVVVTVTLLLPTPVVAVLAIPSATFRASLAVRSHFLT